MTGIMIIASLLHFMNGEHQETKLIGQLDNFFNFDHYILLMNPSADINRFIRTEWTPQSLFVLRNNDDNVTELEILERTNSKNTFVVVVPGSGNFESIFDLLRRIKKIQQFQVKIGIFFQEFVSIDDLRKLFEWCKEQLLVDIFAATYADVIELAGHVRSLNIIRLENLM